MQVAAPTDVNDTSYTMVTVGMEPSSGEPSESGELPPRELTMEQRAEVRQGKRAREPNEVAGGVDPAWSVCRLKEEMDKRGIDTSGRERDLAARLAAAMANEGGGEGEAARPRMCMRER